jgi:hypothetical protein
MMRGIQGRHTYRVSQSWTTPTPSPTAIMEGWVGCTAMECSTCIPSPRLPGPQRVWFSETHGIMSVQCGEHYPPRLALHGQDGGL